MHHKKSLSLDGGMDCLCIAYIYTARFISQSAAFLMSDTFEAFGNSPRPLGNHGYAGFSLPLANAFSSSPFHRLVHEKC